MLLLGLAVALLVLTALPYLAYVGLYALVRPEGFSVEPTTAEPTVSVVLPTYNESAIVERTLDRLCELDYPNDQVEIVVTDDSDDETPDRVRSFFADRDAPDLTLVTSEERRGVATAVNDAISAADGDVIFRTDCDAELAEDAIREAVATLQDSDVGLVTGPQTEVLGESQVESDYRDILTRLQLLESELDSTFVCHGPCTAFRREAYVPVPDDTIADDTETAVRIRRSGKRVVLNPAMRFAEVGTSQFRDRRQRKDRRAMGLLQVLGRHRDAIGRYGAYGRIVLPFNLWFMAISPWLVAASVVAATGAALTLAGPFGFVVPLGLLFFGWLGQYDSLGPLQPIHAVLDSQASLFVAAIRLARDDEIDGTWSVDRTSREAFE